MVSVRLPISILLTLVSALSRAAEAISASEEVHVLTSSNFDSAIRSNPLTFVEFYAPWCGHCKKLAPEWEKTASLAKSVGVPIAKVDAIAEEKLGRDHGVQSFPTFKLFRGDPTVVNSYSGERTATKMVEWLKIWRDATLVEDVDAPSLEKRGASGKISIIGLRSGNADNDANTLMGHILEAASFTLNSKLPGSEVPVAQGRAGSSQELLASLGLNSTQALPCIVLRRNFDFVDKTVVYHTKTWRDGAGTFMKWFEEKRVPALIPGQQDTQQFFLQGSAVDPGHGLVMLFGGDENLARGVHKLAVTSGDEKLKWVHIANKEDSFSEGLAKTVGLTKDDFPELVIWEFGETEDDDKVYRLSEQTMTGDLSVLAVEDLVNRWKSGELTAVKDPVFVLTSDNFDEHVIKSQRDVLVEFYAPWCGQCKSLAPVYKELGAFYSKDDSVRIAKMDATKHKHKSAEVKSYPTLKFYAQGSKDSPSDIPFKGNRDRQSLIDIVEEHRSGNGGMGKRQGTGKTSAEKHGAPIDSAARTQENKAGITAAASAPDADEGAWIFDDAADKQLGGQELSSDMVHSRKGHTLVRYGQIGILIMAGNPSESRAVRRFETADAARAHARRQVDEKVSAEVRADGQVDGRTGPLLGAMPCPSNADITSCTAWCDGVAQIGASLTPKFKGSSCTTWKGKEADAPKCSCNLGEVVQAMCVSPCSKKKNKK